MKKYKVINRYGIKLAAGRREGQEKGGTLYVPKQTDKAGYEACEAWIRRHDTANTAEIVEER